MRVRRIGCINQFAEFSTQALILAGKLVVDFVGVENLTDISLSFDLLQRIGEESFEVHEFSFLGFVERRTFLDADDLWNNDVFSLGKFRKRFQLGAARHELIRGCVMSVDLTKEPLNLNVAVFLGVERGQVNIIFHPEVAFDFVIGRKTFGGRINRKHFAGVFATIDDESIVVRTTSCARQQHLGQGCHVNNVSIDKTKSIHLFFTISSIKRFKHDHLVILLKHGEDVIDDLRLNTLGILNDGDCSGEANQMIQVLTLAAFDNVRTIHVTFARRVEFESTRVTKVDRVIFNGFAVVIVTIFAAHSITHNVVGTIEVVHFTKHTLERPQALCAFELLGNVSNEEVTNHKDALFDIVNGAIRVLQAFTRGRDVEFANRNVELNVAVRQQAFDSCFGIIVFIELESGRGNGVADITHDSNAVTTIGVTICLEDAPIRATINGGLFFVSEVGSTAHDRLDLEEGEQATSSIDEIFAVGGFYRNHNFNTIRFVSRSGCEFSDLTDLRGINVSVVDSLDAVVVAIDDKVVTIGKSGLTAKT